MSERVALDGDVVAVVLLNATSANEIISLDCGVLSILKQDADRTVALELVVTNRDASINARRRLWRFGGKH